MKRSPESEARGPSRLLWRLGAGGEGAEGQGRPWCLDQSCLTLTLEVQGSPTQPPLLLGEHMFLSQTLGPEMSAGAVEKGAPSS